MKNLHLTKRITSLILCAVILFGLMPMGMFLSASAAPFSESVSRTVDEHTLDQWKQYFGVQSNNSNDVLLSTEFAGGVWTDKSVFTPDNIPAQLTNAKYHGKSFNIEDKGDNFLVSLSAIASNKQIKGYSTIPTDTVLILDLSSSMRSTDDNGGSAVDELVEATNKAITELLSLNNNNRVAVVVYAGNEEKAFGVDSQGITSVVMPLDRYTTATADTYLVAKSVGRDANHAIEVAPNVKNSKNQTMSANRFEVSTSTYMQDGIYEAMKVLLNADTTVKEGVQQGTQRMPIMVLMTDGEPTLGTADYNGNNNRTDLGVANLNNHSGDTGEYSHRDTIAFVTSLTAAFAKKEIEKHYGRSALMYTLPYGNTVLSRPEALSVLNPAQSSSTQNALWSSFLNGKEIAVFRKGNRPNYQYVYTSNSTVEGEKLSAEDRLYVDKYFPARNDDEMLNAFEAIVSEIVLQSKYYPTYVENDVNHDGYLTFVDKIGSYMEVSKVFGIVVGERLFSGAAIAAHFPEDFSGVTSDILADDMINSVKERLGIIDTTVAIALIQDAHDHKQLYYESDEDFEHYIGWFSDKNGDYVDFWHKDMTADQYAAAMKKGATHVIRSYAFLGDTTVVPGVSDTDMMYMSVRIATDLTTKDSIVTWKIPASLVPTITYTVDVNVNSHGEITEVIDLELDSQTANSPIKLLYQVELRGDLADWNITEAIDADYVSENGYTFYTNKWDENASDTTLNTYSHFVPSVQNERYCYTEDTVVMVKNGDSYSEYKGNKPSGNGYYREFQVFEKLTNGELRLHKHYEPISAEAMAAVKESGDVWVIPKGTVHRYYDFEITQKTENKTDTMEYSDHPFVINRDGDYYTYSTQGNNGKITVTPATGIKLTKNLAEGYANDGEFTFDITGDIDGAMVVRIDESGYEASRNPIAANGEVTLSAGETVYIIGLAEGEYRVSEIIPENADYSVYDVKIDNASYGDDVTDFRIADGDIIAVEFINGEQKYGSLVVSKDVNYPQGFVPTEAHDSVEFTIDVTFDGDVDGIIAPNGAVRDGNTFSIKLKDGESVTFGRIHEGIGFEVTERDIPYGYTNTDVRYSNDDHTVLGETENQAHVVNNYNPAPVSANVTVNGSKTVIGDWPQGGEFTLKLYEIYDFASGDIYDTGLSATVKADAKDYEIDMSGINFDKAGTYYFRVVEEIPENKIPDMVYDRTFGLFYITVTDTDADGALEIGSVSVYQDTALGGDNENGYTVTKNFTNVVTKDIVYLEVNKTIVGHSDDSVVYTDHLADITFGLFDSMDSENPAYYVLTDANGKSEFAIPVTKDTLPEGGKIYYLREIAPDLASRVVGMHYDESWFGAVRITWNDAENTAVCEYASVKNGVVGAYGEYNPDTTEITHINTYEDSDEYDAELNLSGVKTLNGSTDLGGREFSFSLYETNASFVIQGDAIQTVTNKGNAIVFDSVKLDKAGLHYFSVKEDHSSLGGITNDEKHYHLTVLVEKFVDSDGITRLQVNQDHLHIRIYGGTQHVEPDELNFDNTYTISGETSVVISGEKTLVGRPLINGEFHFNLLQVADAEGTAIENPVTLNTENGFAEDGVAEFRFAELTYNQIGEYFYKITEIKGMEGNGITYSEASFIVKVTVEDNGIGGLNSRWEVIDSEKIEFVNTYTPEKAVTNIYGYKELNGRDLKDGEFTFVLTETERDFITAKENGENRVVTNDIHGIIDFGLFEYDSEGTYYYTVKEEIPAEASNGIVYDANLYHIIVTVEDKHQGMLEAGMEFRVLKENEDQNYFIASSVVFYNQYVVKGNATVELTGDKILEGMELADGMFGFELYTTDSEYNLDGVVPKVTENLDGKYGFRLEYSPVDAGQSFYYLIKETNGGKTINDIIYSSAEYRIRIDVVDNGVGGIEAVVTAEGLDIVSEDNITRVRGLDFVNSYAPKVDEPSTPVQPTPDQPEPDQPEPDEPSKPEPSTPQTGDGTNMVALFILAVTSATVMLWLVMNKRKQNAF